MHHLISHIPLHGGLPSLRSDVELRVHTKYDIEYILIGARLLLREGATLKSPPSAERHLEYELVVGSFAATRL